LTLAAGSLASYSLPWYRAGRRCINAYRCRSVCLRFYRVLYYDDSAGARDPGGLLFIAPQGDGRLDNPGAYEVLYASDTAAGACAEVFNRGKYRMQWSREMLRPLPSNPRCVRALAWYDVDDAIPISDLDDPRELVARRLRPPDVITREYARTQAWALMIFNSAAVAGVRWWSYHDARWASMGLWEFGVITDFGAELLDVDHPAVRDAADVLSIRVGRS